MGKNCCMYLFIFSLILLNVFVIYNCYKQANNENDFFRLHIVANSNSIDDQIVKLNVSKKVTQYISNLTNGKNYSKLKTKKIITENIENILEIANKEISKNNKNYTSYAKIGKISYDKKYSDVINMKAGTYDSVQLILGNGKGQNFWSLIFPYSYNPELTDFDNDLTQNNIKVKFGIIEDIKKMTKFFS